MLSLSSSVLHTFSRILGTVHVPQGIDVYAPPDKLGRRRRRGSSGPWALARRRNDVLSVEAFFDVCLKRGLALNKEDHFEVSTLKQVQKILGEPGVTVNKNIE